MRIQRYFQQGVLFLLVVILISGCSGFQSRTPNYPSEVDWQTAVEILHSGEVEMAAQYHSLEVVLTLKDGTVIRTVEPSIDLLFREVDQCGQPCRGIILATE